MIVVGVGLAAVGAVLGVWAFSDVMKPAELGDADLADFDMGRLSCESVCDVPGTQGLDKQSHRWERDRQGPHDRSRSHRKATGRRGHRRGGCGNEREAALVKDPTNVTLKDFAAQARGTLLRRESTPGPRPAPPAHGGVRLRLKENQLAARRRLRTDALRLKASSQGAEGHRQCLVARLRGSGLYRRSCHPARPRAEAQGRDSAGPGTEPGVDRADGRRKGGAWMRDRVRPGDPDRRNHRGPDGRDDAR